MGTPSFLFSNLPQDVLEKRLEHAEAVMETCYEDELAALGDMSFAWSGSKDRLVAEDLAGLGKPFAAKFGACKSCIKFETAPSVEKNPFFVSTMLALLEKEPARFVFDEGEKEYSTGVAFVAVLVEAKGLDAFLDAEEDEDEDDEDEDEDEDDASEPALPEDATDRVYDALHKLRRDPVARGRISKALESAPAILGDYLALMNGGGVKTLAQAAEKLGATPDELAPVVEQFLRATQANRERT